MARAGTVCRRSGCPRAAVRRGLCVDHARAADAARGTTTERGYGAEHQRRRQRLLPQAIGKPCPRCGLLMLQTHRLELDHSTPLWLNPRSVGDQIVHAGCNPRGVSPENRRQH